MQFNDLTLARIPSLPSVAVRLLNLLSDSESSVHDIVEAVKTDPAITAKLISAANSPRYGTGREVADLHRATMLLGRSTVSALALSFTIADKSMASGVHGAAYRNCWINAVLRAVTAESLARLHTPARAGDFFVTGLLSGIGKLALLKLAPDDCMSLLQRSDEHLLSLRAVEQQNFGIDHVDVAAAMLKDVGMPGDLISAVQQQYLDPDEASELPADRSRDLVAATVVGAAMADYLCGDQLGLSYVRLHELMGTLFGSTQEEIDQFSCEIRRQLEDAADLFDVDATSLLPPEEITAQAVDRLVELVTTTQAGKSSDEVAAQLLHENGRLRKRVEQLTLQSTVDPLTGVFNRGAFDKKVSEYVAEAQNRSQFVGLMIADVDHFKKINDYYGHFAGDLVLRTIATLIGDCVRRTDFLARYGGEEFVILPGLVDAEALSLLADRIRCRVESSPVAFDDHLIPVTLSLGVVILSPSECREDLCRQLITSADAAMYAAKQKGRNQVVIAANT